MKKALFLLIVACQIIAIVSLVKHIYLKKTKVLGTEVQISPINKENVIFETESESMHYFYEPEPKKTIIDRFDWLPAEKPKNTINADSLNERFDYESEKQADVFRILTIGDSFTYGAFVNTEDNYPEQLEKRLDTVCKNQKTEVINLGVGGYDIQYVVERFIKRGVKYNPDLVIWLINSWNYTKINELIINDVNKINDEATKSGTLEQKVKDKGRYFAWSEATDNLVNSMGFDDITKIQFNHFQNFRNSYKGKLLVVVFSDQLDNLGTAEGQDEYKENKGFDDFISKINKNDKDIALFKDLIYGELETLKFDPHPNPKDYALISQKLSDYLVDKQYFSCN